MYDFYEEPRHLNIKKVIIIAVIFVIIIASIIILIIKKSEKPQKEEEPIVTEISETTTTFYSEDKSISIEVSNAFNLKPYNSNLGYLLDLRSINDLDVFISKENMLPNRNLLEIVEADKTVYLSKFESYSNLSDTKELSINGNLAYTYSFHYLDKTLKKAFYLQIAWIQVNDSVYIFDIEFPLDDLPFNTNIFSSILSSFKILN